jgi:hypothetical protein
MKKILIAVFALIAVSVSFASCDNMCNKTGANDSTAIDSVMDTVQVDSVATDTLVDVE